MKNIFKTFVPLAIVASLFIGCDDKLEDIRPEDDLSDLITFGDFGLIEASTIAMYSESQHSDANGTPQIIADMMTDNANFVGSFPTYQAIRDYETLAGNATATAPWFRNMLIIRSANNIIVNLEPVNPDDVTGLTPENKAQFIAEARFVRALAHFDLVNLFAQPFQVNNGSNLGVPIVTEFFTGDTAPFLQERSTVNQVHEFIRTELIAAIPALATNNRNRATKGAAEGLLARLHLYRGEWQQAAERATNALAAPGVSLAPDYGWIENASSEHIYRIVNLADDGAVGLGFDGLYNPSSNNGRGDLPFAQNLIDAFEEEPEDLRFTFKIEATDAGNNAGAFFTTKYPAGTNTAESDFYVIRAAEMHLTRAEANFNNSSSIGASVADDVNAIRGRALLGPATTIDIDVILNERRKELCFEGHRRMDLLRYGRNLRPNGGAVSAFGANRTIMPISQIEIENNPNITQNPGY